MDGASCRVFSILFFAVGMFSLCVGTYGIAALNVGISLFFHSLARVAAGGDV